MPNAFMVLRRTIGFSVGAPNKNAIAIPEGMPFRSSLRTTGTTPHSQTGNTIPRHDPTSTRAKLFFGTKRMSASGLTYVSIMPETMLPISKNGVASMKRLKNFRESTCNVPGESQLFN